ncbi:AraC family transcriptional regulator [Marivivens niveibacter]|uniref:AraC family transcriptional regulator n=1 Tax=Marivivens niveibacter TaxID=1930667 RepID=A0A251WVC0_9RHOB|nr:AraC family transcriptional regulator [Marivivens niveibacter]OUD08429.1 AraC family transcriptional regulator [Marivivens niveibacter]
MDEIEGGVLDRVPVGALALTLTRSTIRMDHEPTWRVDKSNPVYDLIVCLSGQGEYLLDGERLRLKPGHAMLIPPHTRFVGWMEHCDRYTGLAQHFDLTVFGEHNLLELMELRPIAEISPWPVYEPLVHHFRQTAPAGSVTLPQHHQFLVLLNAWINDAFIRWKPDAAQRIGGTAAIDLAVMQAASDIAAHPLAENVVEQTLDRAPYNRDYFQREFQKRTGRTPRKYQEFCRMERAMHFLESGHSVGETAARVGYSDPYYFSRMFKKTMGLSPRAHIEKIRLSRSGQLFQYDEGEQAERLAQST